MYVHMDRGRPRWGGGRPRQSWRAGLGRPRTARTRAAAPLCRMPRARKPSGPVGASGAGAVHPTAADAMRPHRRPSRRGAPWPPPTARVHHTTRGKGRCGRAQQANARHLSSTPPPPRPPTSPRCHRAGGHTRPPTRRATPAERSPPHPHRPLRPSPAAPPPTPAPRAAPTTPPPPPPPPPRPPGPWRPPPAARRQPPPPQTPRR